MDIRRHSNERPFNIIDEALNDSNKSFTCPDGEWWEILWVRVELIATADVGNRQLDIQILDAGADVLFESKAANVQIASATEFYQALAGWDAAASEAVATFHWMPLPEKCFVEPGGSVKVFDSAAVAAAADDMTVHLAVVKHSTL